MINDWKGSLGNLTHKDHDGNSNSKFQNFRCHEFSDNSSLELMINWTLRKYNKFWLCENVEIWKYGNVEISKYGNAVLWKYRNMVNQ